MSNPVNDAREGAFAECIDVIRRFRDDHPEAHDLLSRIVESLASRSGNDGTPFIRRVSHSARVEADRQKDRADALDTLIHEKSVEIERLKSSEHGLTMVIMAICRMQPNNTFVVPSTAFVAVAVGGCELQRISDFSGIKFRVVEKIGPVEPVTCDHPGCAIDPGYVCNCPRCRREPEESERFHACVAHIRSSEIAEKHLRVYGIAAFMIRQEQKCISPSGRADGHMKYMRNGKCMFCGEEK